MGHIYAFVWDSKRISPMVVVVGKQERFTDSCDHLSSVSQEKPLDLCKTGGGSRQCAQKFEAKSFPFRVRVMVINFVASLPSQYVLVEVSHKSGRFL